MTKVHLTSLDTSNEQQVKEFRKLYNEAKRDDKTYFTFEGEPVLTQYGKYVLEYCDLVNNPKKE